MELKIKIEKWLFPDISGYKPCTTFWDDFCIAEKFGVEAVEETYNRAFNDWKNDIKYVTELSLVTNWRLNAVYEKEERDEEMFKLYSDIWHTIDNYCCLHFTGEDLKYYYDTTD